MIETIIPRREPVCSVAQVLPIGHTEHRPGPHDVESGHNHEMEWQHSTCLFCTESISRYRLLRGGAFFDQWGVLIIGGVPDGQRGGGEIAS